MWKIKLWGRNAPERKATRQTQKTSEDINRQSVFYTWDADKSRGVEGLVVGRKGGKLCVSCVDRQVGTGTFHIVPTFFHNPAVSTIWWPARGEERRGCIIMFTWIIYCHLYHSKMPCDKLEHCNNVCAGYRCPTSLVKFSLEVILQPVTFPCLWLWLSLHPLLSLHISPHVRFVFRGYFIQVAVRAKPNLPILNLKQHVPAKSHSTPQECPQQTDSEWECGGLNVQIWNGKMWLHPCVRREALLRSWTWTVAHHFINCMYLYVQYQREAISNSR